MTVMPLVRTSSGIRPSAEFTRFCTSTAARSGSRPTSNVTVIWHKPLFVTGRGHVDHALDAVDDRLERSRDGAFHRLRVGAGVERAHANSRRRELRIAADGQRRNRDRAGQSDEDGADRREDRSSYEDVGDHYGALARD